MRLLILGIDPGRQKMGLALVDAKTQEIVHRAIVAAPDLDELLGLVNSWTFSLIAVGDSTGSRTLVRQLRSAQKAGDLKAVPITTVNERNSTLEGRTLYWKTVPRYGWRRWVPLGLQSPPVPVDDFAAAVVAGRALAYSGFATWDEFLAALTKLGD